MDEMVRETREDERKSMFTEDEKHLMRRFAAGEICTQEFRKLSLELLRNKRES